VALLEGSRSAKEVRQAFMQDWIKHYDFPYLAVDDQGKDVTGGDFTDYFSGHGMLFR